MLVASGLTGKGANPGAIIAQFRRFSCFRPCGHGGLATFVQRNRAGVRSRQAVG
jgi:hypothetical protein